MLIFNDEEKAKIKIAMQLVVDDLREIYDKSNMSRIKILCPTLEGIGNDKNKYGWYLLITKHKMIVYNEYIGHDLDFWRNFNLERLFSSSIFEDRNYNFAISFLKVFDETKSRIIYEVKLKNPKRMNLDDYMNELFERYRNNQPLYIDESLLNTGVRQRLDVYEEKGKKIGTFDFGTQIVKIVANDQLDLVYQPQEKNNSKIK